MPGLFLTVVYARLTMRPLWFSLLAVPSLVHTLVTWFLLCAARRWRPSDLPRRDQRWLVVVPARGEGRAIEPTLESVSRAGAAERIRTLVLLDGDDSETHEVADRAGCEVIVKNPPGPSKGAALGWLVHHHEAVLEGVDGVLLLDVGSTLSAEFFNHFSWPRGADAVQAMLSGHGEGAGEAAALSEGFAQSVEDRGREVFGWTVHLRGTGSALSPEAFREIATLLRTWVEDTESTLLMAAAGQRVVLGPPSATVHDEKPATVASAARQRARWLAGQWAVLMRHPVFLLRLLGRRPLEGIGFVGDVLGRPLSLTGLLRLAVAGVLAASVVLGRGGLAEVVAATVIVLSVVADALMVGGGGGLSFSAAVKLGCSWIVALVFLPLNLIGWQRARTAGEKSDETR